MSKRYHVTVNGTVYEVEVEEIAESVPVSSGIPSAKPSVKPESTGSASAKPGAGTPVTAPMQGTILKVAVSSGSSIKKGDLVCLLEAMKMENEIFAPCDGTVTSVAVSAGQTVATGAVIATIG